MNDSVLVRKVVLLYINGSSFTHRRPRDNPMKRTIQSIDLFPVGIPLTRTFVFASGSAGAQGERAPHIFVRITDSEGAVGWGEARPVPQWSYETMETVCSTIENYLAPALTGLEIWDRHGAQERMFKVIGRGPSTGQPIAKAALDMALHDLCARASNLPLRCFLGGSRESDRVELSWTVTAHDPAQVEDDVAEGRAAGLKHFNFKAGVTPETDAAVARALQEAAPAGAFLWADANQGLGLAEATRLAGQLREAGIDVLEQPFPADQFQLMQSLRARTPLALAIDESSVSPADFFHYASARLVDYLVIKVNRSGGLLLSLQQAAVAKACGLPILTSGLTESLLAKCAACQVTLVSGSKGPAALNGSQFLDESLLFPEKSNMEQEGTVVLGDGPGIGVQPDMEGLRKLAWS